MSTVNNLETTSAAETVSQEPKPIDWVWDSFVASGDLFVFVATMKGGKSTFGYSLARSVARGTPFLGHKCKKGAVLMVGFDEHPRSVESSLKKLGVNPADDPLYVEEDIYLDNPQDFERIRAFVREKGITLIVLDSFPSWHVRFENNNAESVTLLKPVLELARDTNAAIGLIHHDPNFQCRFNDANNERENSTTKISAEAQFWALFGIVDQAILMDHRHGLSVNQRVIKTFGGYDATPSELVIELTGNPHLNRRGDYGYSVVSLRHKEKRLGKRDWSDRSKQDLVDAAKKMLAYHPHGNIECSRCFFDSYPMACPCGGLIHASSGPTTSSEYGTSYPFETICDKCGEFTTEEIWKFNYLLHPYIEMFDLKEHYRRTKKTIDAEGSNRNDQHG